MAPIELMVGSGGPVCAAGGGPSCRVNEFEDPDQFSTTIINTSPAETLGAGINEGQPKKLPN